MEPVAADFRLGNRAENPSFDLLKRILCPVFRTFIGRVYGMV